MSIDPALLEQDINPGRPDMDKMIVFELSSLSEKTNVFQEVCPAHTVIADKTGLKNGAVLRMIITLKEEVVQTPQQSVIVIVIG